MRDLGFRYEEAGVDCREKEMRWIAVKSMK
jgi:hypothetical protein